MEQQQKPFIAYLASNLRKLFQYVTTFTKHRKNNDDF